MPFFPAFIDLSDKKVLVVGGGKVATRKVKNLLNFTQNITIVAPKISEELQKVAKEKGLKIKRRRFLTSDLKGKDLVIVAVDDVKLQRRIFKFCERRKILCNAVDSPEYCNFIFPSLIVKGELVIGISTSGKVPALSRRIRELIETHLPEDIDRILEDIAIERAKAKRVWKDREV